MCKPRQRFLCKRDGCTICFERSFASHPKSEFWNVELNSKIELTKYDKKIDCSNPRNLFKNCSDKFWFTCTNCNHDFDAPLDGISRGQWCPYCVKSGGGGKLCYDNDCGHCFNRSFAIHEKAKFWHPTKNKLKPRQVRKSSGRKIWFTCPNCNHDFESKLDNISHNEQWCPYCANYSDKLCDDNDCAHCFNRSFASHEKAKFWHPTKNKLTPRQALKCCNNKFWFTCPNCNHDFDMSLLSVSRGRWCPYCAQYGGKLCYDDDCEHCFNKSFASHEKAKFWHPKNRLTPRQVKKCSGSKFWFTCPNCNHDFDIRIANVINGYWCSYCGNKILCFYDCDCCFNKSFASHEKAKFWHPTRNKLTPRQVYRGSDKKFWFTCPDCNHDFDTSLNNVSGGKWCPRCKHKTEKKLYEFLLPLYVVVQQFRAEWCKNPSTGRYLPFDFVMEALKIIIELDGQQHFTQVRNWASPEEQQSRDLYKMKKANENGYTVIRLLQEDVWNDTGNWQEELIKMINKEYAKPECVFISDGTEYEYFVDSVVITEEFSEED